MNTHEITNKDAFVKFLESLSLEAKNNITEWENQDLPTYLEAMAGWVADMEGYYINQGLPVPEQINWAFFADILLAAIVYE